MFWNYPQNMIIWICKATLFYLLDSVTQRSEELGFNKKGFWRSSGEKHKLWATTNVAEIRLSTENLFNLFFDGETFLTFLFFWKTFLNLFLWKKLFFFRIFVENVLIFVFSG